MVKSQEVEDRHPGILLEVRPADTSGDLAPRTAMPEEFRARAAEVADSIADVAEHFKSRLGRTLDNRDRSAWQVESIEIGFDIAVQAEAGIVIAKTAVGATFSAKLVLKTSQDQPS
jgi:hypothetical protein